MHIFELIKSTIIDLTEKFYSIEIDSNKVTIELPKLKEHGDLSINIAMVIARSLQKPPITIAKAISLELETSSLIKKVEVAGAGFINIWLESGLWQSIVQQILTENINYGFANIGLGEKVNVEYVSANPTGPMHIGHARGAIYGDVLATLLSKMGYDVTKEYYINDAGKQIEALAESLYGRYRELHGYTSLEGAYPGSYLIEIAQKIKDNYGDAYIDKPREEWQPIFSKLAVEYIMVMIKNDLAELGITHDYFTSEKRLHEEKILEEALNILKSCNMVYEGTLGKPKGYQDENWEPKTQLLLRTSEHGDDQDRTLFKSDGQATYLAADAGYALDKIKRGFSSIILVVGADHIGHKKPLEVLFHNLGKDQVKFHFRACQLVNFMQEGKPYKMSKRAGTYVTVIDMIKLVGKDVLRFIMLTRRNDVILDFDIAKVLEQSKDNPVFYVQYAHARVNSIFKMAEAQSIESYNLYNQDKYELSLLAREEEIHLIKYMALWPRILYNASIHHEPHRIVFYLEEIAGLFHALWHQGREDPTLRFVVENNIKLTAARLALVRAVQIIIANGLNLINVKPAEHM